MALRPRSGSALGTSRSLSWQTLSAPHAFGRKAWNRWWQGGWSSLSPSDAVPSSRAWGVVRSLQMPPVSESQASSLEKGQTRVVLQARCLAAHAQALLPGTGRPAPLGGAATAPPPVAWWLDDPFLPDHSSCGVSCREHIWSLENSARGRCTVLRLMSHHGEKFASA